MNKTLLCAALLLSPVLCGAQSVNPPPSGVVNLSATATTEADNDRMTMNLYTEVQERDATAGAARINRTIETALALAKAYPRVTARSGGYSSSPVYDKDRALIAWRLHASLNLESASFAELGELAGKLQGSGLMLAQMGFSLSREARSALEKRVTEDALAQFQERAALIASSLSYERYSIRELSVHGNASAPPAPLAVRGLAASAAAGPPVPVEGGKGSVSVSVSGSIQLERRR